MTAPCDLIQAELSMYHKKYYVRDLLKINRTGS